MSVRVLTRWDWACYVAAGRLTGAQRTLLLVVTRHADQDGHGAFVGQESLAKAAGITERGVRKALQQLEEMELISGERRPGKTTCWRVNFEWVTPELEFRGAARQGWNSSSTPPRNPSSAPAASDPGTTPELPRPSSSYEGEGEGTTSSLSSFRSAQREREIDNVVTFDPRQVLTLQRLNS